MRFDDPLDDVFAGRSFVRVLRALFEVPTGLVVSGREVSRRAGVSHPTAAAVLASLAEQGVVIVRRTPYADEYEINRDHAVVRVLLPLFDWEQGALRELAKLLRDEIAGIPEITAAYLFGSTSRRDMEPSSDVDLAVICRRSGLDEVTEKMETLGGSVRRRFGNRLNVVVGVGSLRALRRSDAPGHELWERIANEGIPISNGLEPINDSAPSVVRKPGSGYSSPSAKGAAGRSKAARRK